jgi:predicted enzyme related to lactoylglutathione lyase
VKENGGQVIIEKMAVPKMGYFALCLDPEENPFGLWLTDENAA